MTVTIRPFAAAAALAVAALLAGCAAPPRAGKPVRSLDELYEIAARVNAEAAPYGLGIGDGVGAQTYTIWLDAERKREPRGTSHLTDAESDRAAGRLGLD